MRQFQVLASTLLAGVVLVCAARSSGADDAKPRSAEPLRSIVVQSGGVIRMIGPDGKMQEQRFGLTGPSEIEGLAEKLQELQQAAGDREAVERISQELLKLVQEAGPQAGARTRIESGELTVLPKFGIGVSLAPEMPAAVRAQLKLGEDEGVLVQSVAKDGPAAKAGIQEHDVLLAVDGTVIKQHSDMVAAVQKAGEAEAVVKVDYISGGEHKSVDVTPSPSNEIDWLFSAVTDAVDPFGRSPRAFTLRMQPGLVHPGEGRIELAPQAVPFFTPHAQQQKLEERIEKLERQLEKLSEQLSNSETK